MTGAVPRPGFGLLGPLRVLGNGPAPEEIQVPQAKHRVVLAALLLRAGADVPAEEIIHSLWGPEPPVTARKTLQGYVARLRKVLGPGLLVSGPGGYRLQVAPHDVDVGLLDQLTRAAAQEGDPGRRAALLHTALGLFRGEPLQDVPSDYLQRHDAAALVDRRLTLLEEWADAELDGGTGGRAGELPARLRVALTEHPFRERLWSRLVLAHVAGGEPAAAVTVYHEARRTLAEQLGVDPGPALRAAYQRALTTQTAGPPGAPRPGRAGETPRARAGRTVVGLLRADVSGGPAAVLVYGPPGVGRTTFARRVAAAVAADFPDGRIRADLDGPAGPRDIDDVLADLLLALDVPVPAAGTARRAAYQRALAGRRVLVVLDDVTGPDQVAALLPEAGPGAALLTGPRAPTGPEQLRHVRLDPFTDDEGRAALLGATGDRWTGPVARADEIVRLGDHLPLAVHVAATRLLGQQRLDPAALCAELSDPDRRLDALSGPIDVRARIVRAYRRMSPGARRALRTVSLLQAPSFAPHVAAEALGLPSADTRTLLDEVTSHHLLEVHPMGRAGYRYRHRDLVRLCARELAVAVDPVAERRLAVERALSAWYRVPQPYVPPEPARTIPRQSRWWSAGTVLSTTHGHEESA